LADLLTDPKTSTKNLEDTFIVSMIREEPVMDSTSFILDALRVPCLTWQLEKGFIASSELDDKP